MKTHALSGRTLPLIVSLAFGGTLAHAVPVQIPADADLEVTENLVGGITVDGASAFDGNALNARFTGAGNNEVIALRFNLAGHNRAQITGAAVRLINYRANAASQTLRIYGVNDNATGYNLTTTTEGTATDDNWPESGTLFSTTPGLEFDDNSATRGIRSDRVTDLGTAAMGNTAEGSEVLISTPSLIDFLVNHPDDTVTILVVAETVNTGQKRFASRHATTLESGSSTQPAGTWAPRLVIELPGIRIPTTADLQVNEQNNSGNGGGTQINARFYTGAAPGNNEVIAMRFDLTGYTPSDIISAGLSLVNHRNNSASTLHCYGVLNGATGYNAVTATEGSGTDNDWPEGSTNFGTMPGFEYDNVVSTPGIRSDRTTDLGTITTSASNGNINKGTKVTFSNANLINFLKNHPDNIITLLFVTDSNNSGQKRFASKEATLLDGDVSPQPAGTYAPEISLLLANADRDGDGLLNNWEELHGFNPDLVDSDTDGTPDGQEDTDSDFLINIDEQTKTTDPNNPDTDSDDLLDGYENGGDQWTNETLTGTNPLVADTDGDGLSDGIENPEKPFLDGTQPGTDPNLRDTDHDLYSDGAEIARNSDPTDAEIVPDGAVLELLGTGSGALIGSPLTDPDNNIDDTTLTGSNFNWKAVTTSEKPFFGTGVLGVDPQNMSGAYDLFDRKVGPLNDKWLAGGLANVAGAHTTVEFAGEVELTSFTISSADDRPERDPVNWQILGSNDGANFTPIFTQSDPANVTLWSARNQVVKCTLASTTPKYRFVRFHCTKAGENTFHLNEIEYFGTFTADPVLEAFKIISMTGGPSSANYSLTWTSQPGSNYRIGYSTTLADSFIGDAAVNVPAEAGSTTTHSFPNPAPNAPQIFFRVEKP